MNSDLRARASAHFEQYLQACLQRNERNGLPAHRLSEQEWKMLNESLLSVGVQLVPAMYKGYLYYWFQKTQPVNKIDVYNQGREKIIGYLIQKIKDMYPDLSEQIIRKMIKTRGNSGDIYEILRYKQDGTYNDVSKQEFENAFIYALESAGNRSDLFEYSYIHRWSREAEKYERYHYGQGKWNNWPTSKRYISMTGTQDWTWFRKCEGQTLPAVYDSRNPKGFHISLNVRVTADLLRILDDILIDDGGAFIESYKFPKTSEFDQILTRHDPVTIYTNARNYELEKRIARAVQPFVRSNEGMIGETLGNGVCINPETSYDGKGISVGQQISVNIANIINQYGDRL